MGPGATIRYIGTGTSRYIPTGVVLDPGKSIMTSSSDHEARISELERRLALLLDLVLRLPDMQRLDPINLRAIRELMEDVRRARR